MTFTADELIPGLFSVSASDLATAYTAAGLTELEIPPEALVITADDGIADNVDPSATTWLQPVVTSYNATDGLTIKLNGNVEDATPASITIKAQMITPGSDALPMEVPLDGLTLVPGEAAGTYTLSASDLATALAGTTMSSPHGWAHSTCASALCS